jgi:hypothetical protein
MVKSFKQLLQEDAPKWNLQEEYEKFNQLYFQGELPQITLRYKNLRVHGVCISFQNKDTKVLRLDRIEISNRYHMSYENFKRVLIHEMIHAYLSVHQLTEREMHGVRFLSMMRNLNNRYGLSIDVNAEMEGVAKVNKNVYDVWLVHKLKENKYVLAFLKDDKDEKGMQAVGSRYYTPNNRLIHMKSSSSELMGFGLSRSAKTMKMYLIDKEMFDKILSSGKVLTDLIRKDVQESVEQKQYEVTIGTKRFISLK